MPGSAGADVYMHTWSSAESGRALQMEFSEQACLQAQTYTPLGPKQFHSSDAGALYTGSDFVPRYWAQACVYGTAQSPAKRCRWSFPNKPVSKHTPYTHLSLKHFQAVFYI